MRLHNIRIRDFKSLYGDNYFDFDTLDGLVKLSGAIGSGKTSLGEAIIWGLFGTIKKINNTHLIASGKARCPFASAAKSMKFLLNSSRISIINTQPPHYALGYMLFEAEPQFP